MPFYTYVLYSRSFNKIYIGSTSDLNDRLLSHNELATKGYTIHFRPWIVAFHEEFETKSEALRREKSMKTSRGREYVWNRISELGLITTN